MTKKDWSKMERASHPLSGSKLTKEIRKGDLILKKKSISTCLANNLTLQQTLTNHLSKGKHGISSVVKVR